MERLVHLSLLVVWLLGAILTGVSVDPVGQASTPQHAVRTDGAILAVHDDQVVLTVGLSESAQWRIAAPLPSFLLDSLRRCSHSQSAVPQEAADRSEAPRESATFIPL